jgi:hypothetical protein
VRFPATPNTTATSRSRFATLKGIALAIVVPFKEEGYMLWILAVIMGGLGFGYVTVRRRRKAEQKTT